MIESIARQDRDLLWRMSQYLEMLDGNLEEGCGWLIFNADRNRTSRIARFLVNGLLSRQDVPSYCLLPWRDFALHAYMFKVELVSGLALARSSEASTHLQKEYTMASEVSLRLYQNMLESSLFMLLGVEPAHLFEAKHLDSVLSDRWRRRGASVLITPMSPEGSAEVFRTLDPSGACWRHIFGEMYRTSLIAL